MKKIFLLLLTCAVFNASFAQNSRKPASLGISFFMNDFQTAAELRKTSLQSVIRNHNLLKFSRMQPGIAINYVKGVLDKMDFSATLGGSFVNYPIRDHADFADNYFLMEATASLNIKLLSDNYWVVPFIDLGVGVSEYKDFYSAFMPFGVGLQINLGDAYVFINSQYRVPVTESANYHFYHSIGFAIPLMQK